MASVTTFIRKTPAEALRLYFERVGIKLPSTLDWSAPQTEVARPILRAVDDMDEVARARITCDAERVSEMADEAGETALFDVAEDRVALAALENRFARALWMFLNHSTAFRHAEEVRFTDERRRGRMWDGFVAQSGLTLQRDGAALDRFKAAVRESFESKNVHVDVFDRQRPTFEGQDCELVQATVYRDGRLDDFLEFVDGSLDRRPRRPVYEGALTYEPSTGVIEVVANDRESRESFVRLFARELLGTEFKQERLPLRRYDLGILSHSYDFPTDPEDGVESVRVSHLRLMPLSTVGERVTLECKRQSSQTIWQMASEHFGSTNPLLGGWVVTQAKLTIRFHPAPGTRRGRILPLTLQCHTAAI